MRKNRFLMIVICLLLSLGIVFFAACGDNAADSDGSEKISQNEKGSEEGSGEGDGTSNNGSPSSVYVIVDADGAALENGEYLLFGEYPQTRVTDASITAALDAAAGDLPGRKESEFNGWRSYGYYKGNGTDGSATQADFMFYKDVTHQEVKYRGVYLSGYRPDMTIRMGTPNNTKQDDNGYLAGDTVYWFRYEPIKWRILKQEEGVALVISECILDSQAYLNVAENVGVDAKSKTIFMNKDPEVPANTYANNYKYSSIRAWLNGDYYDTAFTSAQKTAIALTTVDNGITSSYPANGNETNWNSGSTFLCENTEDYLFLPGEADITNAEYGFLSPFEGNGSDKKRLRTYSDYALVQGLNTVTGNYADYGSYWLRSPYESNFDHSGYGDACRVDEKGYCASHDFVINTSNGVVPMLRITLS